MKIGNNEKKQPGKLALLVASVALALTLNGCSEVAAADQTDAKLAKLEKQVQMLESRVEELDKQSIASQKELSQAIDSLKLKQNTSKELALKDKAKNPHKYAKEVSFTDIQGVHGEEEIKMMAALGIFADTEGEFAPTGSITRAEFVRWLVTTNNRYSKLGLGNRQPIRLAEHKTSTFSDVSPNHPNFRYIQGMVDAGFVIGYDETTFAPDRPLSREELVAIKGAVDYNENKTSASLQSHQSNWSDSHKISTKYYGAFYWDRYTHSPNIERTFGSFKAFRPQQNATRAEASICLTAITNHNNTIHGAKHALAKDALKKLNRE